MKIFKTLQKPLTSEKTSNIALKKNSYVFQVDPKATKIDIKKSIFSLYGVEVSQVNILKIREKFKYGKKRNMLARKKSGKKAYITLRDPKAKIDFTILA